MRLKNKTTIITGGGRGIGRAVALGFAKEGAQVIVAARTEKEINVVAEEIRNNGGQSLAAVCDISNEEDVRNMVNATLDKFGKIDVLINNAGIGNVRPVYGISLEAFEKVLNVNLIGTFLCAKHVWKPMKSSGKGSIINVSSLGGLKGYPFLSAYCASKWGQIGFTKSCAEEGKSDNIRVNAIAPGKADTALRELIKEDKSKMLTANDHIPICIFLASDESKYITGQVMPIEWYGSK